MFIRQRTVAVARFLFASFVFVAFAFAADIVELADGSRIVGQARKLEGGRLSFSTDFAGDLELDWARVKTLDTTHPTLRELKPVVPPPPPSLDPQERVWNYDVAFALAGKSGNTDKFQHGVNLGATMTGPVDELKLHLASEWARTEGEKTDDNLTLGVDYERAIGESRDNSWYVRSEYYRDTFKDIDYRWTTAAGVGHYFFREPMHSLRGRIGLFYTHEKYDDPPFGSTADLRGKEDTIGLDLGVNHAIEWREWLKIVTSLTYLPEFDDIKDFRARHETAVDIPIAGSALWKLRLGIANDYNSQPANQNKRLDTSYFARLVLAWQHGNFLKSSGLFD